MDVSQKNQLIKARLHKGLFQKSVAAAPTFFLIAFAINYFHPGVVINISYLRWSMYGAMVSALLRFLLATFNSSKNTISVKSLNWMVFAILLNSLSWAIGFSFIFTEVAIGSTDFFASFIVCSSFLSSSIVTLSYIPFLAVIFQISLPSALIFLQAATYFKSGDNIALFLAVALLVYVLYALVQTFIFYGQLLKRFEHEIDLEESLELLKKSKEQIASDVLKMYDLSRLAALADMSSGLSHEINNPLAIIQGKNYQIAREADSGKLDLQLIRKYIETIDKNTNRIAIIVKKLSEFSKSTEGENFRRSSLKDVVESAISFYAEKFKDFGIKVTVASIPDEFTLVCRPSQITQVILCLLDNSYFALLKSNTKWIRIDFKQINNFVEISVEDSGPGIPKEFQNKIMEPFFTTKGIGGGAGLGLSSSLGIISAHGGTLKLDASSPNTRFVIQLPLTQDH